MDRRGALSFLSAGAVGGGLGLLESPGLVLASPTPLTDETAPRLVTLIPAEKP